MSQGRQLSPERAVERQELASLMYQALASSHGVAIRAESIEELRRELYKVRTELNDPELSQLGFVPSRTAEGEFWIIKRRQEPSSD